METATAATTLMPFVTPDLAPALPEMFLLAAACTILVIDVFLRDDQRHVTYALTQLSLLGVLLLVIVGHTDNADSAPASLAAFGGHYLKDTLSDILKGAIVIISAAVFLYSRDYLRERDLFKGEYFLLGLFGILGMMIMVSAGSLLSVYLGLELFSLSTYALVAFHRDSPQAAEAAMKYFVLGALASGMLLYGVSMIYGATGSLILGEVATATAARGSDDLVLVFGLVFLVIGLGFKLGAVPFHMWLPDVYQGAPTSVTLYVGAAPKLAAFALLIRVLVEGLAPLVSDWGQMLTVLAALSIGTGNLIAIAQTNLKRLLAYSTIAHVGFILLGVLAGTNEGYTAALFYAITYALMTTGAFGVLLILSRNGLEAEQLSDLKGLNDRSPWLAFLMLLLMMSLAGIPFLVGFYAKLAVLQAVISVDLMWLALLAVVFSVIGAFYYLRVIKYMYFDRAENSDQASNGNADAIEASLDTQIVISANGLLLIALGLYPTALMTLCAAAFSA